MLILTRKSGEKIKIGDDIVISVVGISKGVVRIGIDAPREIAVLREEVYERVLEENIASSEGGIAGLFKAAKIMKRSGTETGERKKNGDA